MVSWNMRRWMNMGRNTSQQNYFDNLRYVRWCSLIRNLQEWSREDMIRAIIVFNNQGKPRLTKFYSHYVSKSHFRQCPFFLRVWLRETTFLPPPPISLFLFPFPFPLQTEDEQQSIIKEVFHLVSRRDESVCNFLEGPTYVDLHKSRMAMQTLYLELRIKAWHTRVDQHSMRLYTAIF